MMTQSRILDSGSVKAEETQVARNSTVRPYHSLLRTWGKRELIKGCPSSVSGRIGPRRCRRSTESLTSTILPLPFSRVSLSRVEKVFRGSSRDCLKDKHEKRDTEQDQEHPDEHSE